MRCPTCDAEQPEGAKFCNQCGAQLPSVTPVVAAPDGRCAACGWENVPGSRFCSECGAALAVAPVPAVTSASAPLRFVSAKGMTIHVSPSASNTWLVGRDDPVSGIHPDVDLTPYDPDSSVSRRHAQITLAGHQYLLTSVATTNWTSLNGSRLTPHQAVLLRPGDRIEFGRCVVTFDTLGTFGN